jgi:hypothetical protein
MGVAALSCGHERHIIFYADCLCDLRFLLLLCLCLSGLRFSAKAVALLLGLPALACFFLLFGCFLRCLSSSSPTKGEQQ